MSEGGIGFPPSYPAPSELSVGEHRHRVARVAVDQACARDRPGAVAVAHVVDRLVEQELVARVERQWQLQLVVVLQVRDCDSDECQTALFDQRRGRSEKAARDGEHGFRVRGRLRERVRACGACEVVEPEPEHDGPADPAGFPHPARDAVDKRDDVGIDVLEPAASTRPLRADRAPALPRPHRTRVEIVRQRVQVAPGGTTSNPSGFATALATLARNFVRATPTVIGSPTRSRTSRRSRSAIFTGAPKARSIPLTSRNASSIDRPSTRGDVSPKSSNPAQLASTYAEKRGLTTTACRHRARARRSLIAVRTP